MRFLRRLPSRLSDAAYWLRYRLDSRHRYHVVNTGLAPGYYDVDTLMLHACMALLCRYIEDEMGGEAKMADHISNLFEEISNDKGEDHWSAESFKAQATYEKEALAIYCWWKREKPADEALNERQMMARYGHPRDPVPFCSEEEFRALEDKIAADEQAMLHRLIDIRVGLWT